MFQSIFQILDTAATAGQPVTRAIARTQVQSVALASRRGQAYVELPSRLARCRTPHEVMLEQMQFWQTCMTQYAQASQHIMQAWADVAVPASVESGAVDIAHRDGASREVAARDGLGARMEQTAAERDRLVIAPVTVARPLPEQASVAVPIAANAAPASAGDKAVRVAVAIAAPAPTSSPSIAAKPAVSKAPRISTAPPENRDYITFPEPTPPGLFDYIWPAQSEMARAVAAPRPVAAE